MSTVEGSLLQLLLLCAAFWVAIAGFRALGGAREDAVRFVGGLVAGAVLAHLGWAALHWRAVALHPASLLDPTTGFCVLFLPVGVAASLVAAPPQRRVGYAAAAFSSLPAALAVARLGCLVAGCCHGLPTTRPWGVVSASGVVPLHPTALFEIGALLALALVTRLVPRAWVPALVCIGFGGVRLALEPFRAAPPLGTPAVPVELLAAGLIALGAGLAAPALGAARRRRGVRALRSAPAP